MASIPTATAITPAGVDTTTLPTAAASTNTFANNGKVMLVIANGSVSSINATFVSQKVVADGGGDLAVADRVVAVPANTRKVIGPFDRSIYNDLNNEVTVQISVTTSVTMQALQLTPATT